MASSLDYEVTLATVANLSVPFFADWCTVHIVKPDGQIERLAVEHRDPAMVAKVRELTVRYPPARTTVFKWRSGPKKVCW